MDKLKFFGLLIKLVWWIAGLFADAAKRNKAEPVETIMDPADTAPAVKLPIGRRTPRTAKRAPPALPPESLS